MVSSSLMNFLNKNLGVDLYPDLSNERVIELYIIGSCSFDQVLIRYQKLLIKKSQKYIPGYSSDDVFQELVIKLSYCCSNYDGRVKFITYLYTCLDNHLSWLYRREMGHDNKKANHGDPDRDTQTQSYDFMVDNGYDTEIPWSTHCQEEEIKIMEILNSVELTGREKICVDMVFEGRQNKEIAKILNISGTRVKQILGDLRPRFAELLNKGRIDSFI